VVVGGKFVSVVAAVETIKYMEEETVAGDRRGQPSKQVEIEGQK